MGAYGSGRGDADGTGVSRVPLWTFPSWQTGSQKQITTHHMFISPSAQKTSTLFCPNDFQRDVLASCKACDKVGHRRLCTGFLSQTTSWEDEKGERHFRQKRIRTTWRPYNILERAGTSLQSSSVSLCTKPEPQGTGWTEERSRGQCRNGLEPPGQWSYILFSKRHNRWQGCAMINSHLCWNFNNNSYHGKFFCF